MEVLIVKAVYIVCGTVAIWIGANFVLFPEEIKQNMKDQQTDKLSKDRLDKSMPTLGIAAWGFGPIVFGAALIFKGLTLP